TTEHVLVHTGQNWDYLLNGIFFDELSLRQPDHVLDVDTSSLGTVLGDILRKVEPVLRDERPDAFLVLGDTNSAIAALMAKRMRIPVYHMEAGNRCFDENVPEETNRRLVDHIADFNLVYTEHARRNLLSEGLHPRRIMLTGSPMREVLDHYLPKIEASNVLDELSLQRGKYIVVSAHREENVDAPERLRALLGCLIEARDKWRLPILVSTHPRTRIKLEALDHAENLSGIDFKAPFGFAGYNRLQMNAFCVLSDSGTISEESSLLGFPAVTLRSSIERPEALDTGSIIMNDLHRENVVGAIAAAVSGHLSATVPTEYTVDNCSLRACNFIMSTAFEHAHWAGLR
ncbi:MAG: UDP-N-acetylglucosamine 2-epimerase (non-hydrolyzing), partial [Chloroflexi bacterium]